MMILILKNGMFLRIILKQGIIFSQKTMILSFGAVKSICSSNSLKVFYAVLGVIVFNFYIFFL
jgi:hypothetical protein